MTHDLFDDMVIVGIKQDLDDIVYNLQRAYQKQGIKADELDIRKLIFTINEDAIDRIELAGETVEGL